MFYTKAYANTPKMKRKEKVPLVMVCLQRHVKHPEASQAEICKTDGRALPCDENGSPHPQRTTVSPFTLRGQILCKIPMRLRILPQYHPSFLGVLHVVFCRLLRNPDAPITCKKKRDDAFTRLFSGIFQSSTHLTDATLLT
jgi:hypothetical protein